MIHHLGAINSEGVVNSDRDLELELHDRSVSKFMRKRDGLLGETKWLRKSVRRTGWFTMGGTLGVTLGPEEKHPRQKVFKTHFLKDQ